MRTQRDVRKDDAEMTISEIATSFQKYGDIMEFLPPVSLIDVAAYEKKNHCKLPVSYVELLKHFNGGEIFIPGTVIYGIRPRDVFYSVDAANASDIRNSVSIPDGYLIIGRLNFGDYICIDLSDAGKVIQWDHENDEEFMRWESIEAWLTESIEDFQRYNGEV